MSIETRKLVGVTLDEASIARRSPDIDHERKVAIFDLLDENHFSPIGDHDGPYHLHLAVAEARLVFDIRNADTTPLGKIILAMSPFRSVIRDYLAVCESYYSAIKTSTPQKIEAIDMGRRGLHNQGSELLMERLKGKIDLDFDTARRLFTLICVLFMKG
ncbi:UPF0262 family protein [Zavarzinia compransoris]|uniref:UPF0262 protein DKG75_16925 n=1 Tax=Zavarzinia compransoris TaxID=1264899 RepID=A0A317DVH6_9PROT|nr:UPF0262 family protein [Zavarzinia compransoris]PWR18678.1 hypothetical protein DKG75_16925 [Zavarzinia compransoris]TDP48652.1 uncharacterized protein (UPF0262 family) [Zavarzinia compransoris]